ncbi:uncharacterized protein METZ01_LOCUS152444 [marine metagenome]|uniref:Uncharacterized protein n=1 Tax=marine metagenome TaxID=408172 RepID=A0A382ADF3_9ZZZZ
MYTDFRASKERVSNKRLRHRAQQHHQVKRSDGNSITKAKCYLDWLYSIL